jgi:hypothetical protein
MPEYNYNWPYDYFSLVEMTRIKGGIKISGEKMNPRISVDIEGKPPTLVTDEGSLAFPSSPASTQGDPTADWEAMGKYEYAEWLSSLTSEQQEAHNKKKQSSPAWTPATHTEGGGYNN